MKFKEKKFADLYEKRLSKEGYPGNLFDEIMDSFVDANSIIDVGAGTGFLSIPLVKAGYRVLAIEPSNEMIKILKSKLDEDISSRLEIYHGNWETWKGERADCLICIHSIYGIRNIREAIKKMDNSSNRKILIIKSDSGVKTLSEIIREKLLKKKRCSTGFPSRILSFLNEFDIKYTIKEIEQRRDSRFVDINDEAEYYCYHLGINREKIDFVKSLIEESSQRMNNSYIFRGVYRDLLITW